VAHECRQRLEHVARITKRCGQCLRGTDREAAGEDRESAENGLLRGAEECVTPPDHLAKGPVALGKITRVAPQHVEVLVEPRQQRARWKKASACRRELDRQRHPIEAPTDASDGRRVLDAEREVGTHCLGALDEQADCVAGVGEPLRRGHLLGGSDEERWHRELVLTADA
jgi:hypothetical protein